MRFVADRIHSLRTLCGVVAIAIVANIVCSRTACAEEVWQSLAGGMSGNNSSVSAVTTYNGDLIAGGLFVTSGGVTTNGIARWNGLSWHALGTGVENFGSGSVHSLTVYNGELIAGGFFSAAGGQAANSIARWNGSAWQPMGIGVSGPIGGAVFALTVYNNELIAAGTFTSAGGVPTNNIARWNGSIWQPLGSGMNNTVRALTVYNNELIAAGQFTTAGGISAASVARWNGTAWLSSGIGNVGPVHALTVYNGQLIAGGNFGTAGGVSALRVARWNGSVWQPLQSGLNEFVYSLTVYNGELIVGGLFTGTGAGLAANHIARWNGVNWQPPLGTGLNDRVFALTSWNGALIAGGLFSFAGGQQVNYIAQSTANSTNASCELWQPLSTGPDDSVLALTTFNHQLMAGGAFTSIGGVAANRIARWNGAVWQSLGSGMTSPCCSVPYVNALTLYNNELIAGGAFRSAGGVIVNSIARWNGSTWQPLGSGISEFGSVYALAEFNGELIAGGSFLATGGNSIARWNGTSWVALGGGMDNAVHALTVYNGELFAGGLFGNAGGIPANFIARWDGSAWHSMGQGLGTFPNYVSALAVYNGELIVGGGFDTAGGVPVNNIARWNGSAWQPMGSGITGSIKVAPRVTALAIFNGDLIAGGTFAIAGGVGANCIARWDGSSWDSLGVGMTGTTTNPSVAALVEFINELFAGGRFDFPARNIVRWHPNEWSAANSGLFSDNFNWDLGYALNSPTSFGTTPGATPFIVTFNAAAQSSSLCITNQRPVFELNGQQYSISDYTTVGGTQTAQLTVNNGTLSSPLVAIGSFGTLAGNGQIVGNVFNVGTVRPGSSPTSPGTLTLLSNYEQDFGVFNPLIGPSQHSLLSVGGQASIAGTLKVELTGNPQIQLGQQFPILTCGGALTGEFGAALLPDIGNSLVMNVQYTQPMDDAPPSPTPPNGRGEGGIAGAGGVVIIVGTPDGNPDFGDPQSFVLNGEPTGVTGADIGNIPAANDIAMCINPPVPTDPGSVLVLLNQGNGTSFTPVVVPVGHVPSGIVAAKLAGGAQDDLAVTNAGDDNLTILFNNGGGSFTPLNIAVGNNPSAIAAGNFRGAAGGNLIDLAVTNRDDNTVTVLINNGNNTFTAMPPIAVGSQPLSIASAQLMGDPLPELIIANFASNIITILINQGAGAYSNGPLLPGGNGPVTVDPADVDNDRDVDIVVSVATAHSIALIVNLGAGQFSPAANLPIGGIPGSIDNWDMDADGDLDLVAVVNDDALGPITRILRNDTSTSGGTLAFTLFDPIGVGEEPRLVRGTDVTGDRLEDLVAVNVITSPLAGGPPSSSMSVRPNLIPPAVPGDITGNGFVNVDDLLAVINAWGPCPQPCPPRCAADIAPPGGNCFVNVDDLLMVINNWG